MGRWQQRACPPRPPPLLSPSPSCTIRISLGVNPSEQVQPEPAKEEDVAYFMPLHHLLALLLSLLTGNELLHCGNLHGSELLHRRDQIQVAGSKACTSVVAGSMETAVIWWRNGNQSS